MSDANTTGSSISRRRFIGQSAAVAGASVIASKYAFGANVAGSDTIRLGLIGCGGRGTGAAANCLEASERVSLVAMADVFEDRLNGSRGHLASRGERATVADDRCYVGFDAYQHLLEEADVDLVILATPPHFRPIHFDAAVKAGKHVFMEKPVAVDAAGVRTVIAAAEQATKKKLSVVSGTQRRHETCYLEAMQRIRDGAIGEIRTARCYWNQGGLWHKNHQQGWTDMEWQLRNWLYFTWLSGDHICEQHIHNLDVVNWAMDAHPVKAMGMGGRQARTQEHFGHIFDHFAVEYTYPNGAHTISMCRQIDGCANRVEENIVGTDGVANLRSGYAAIEGANEWFFEKRNNNPYVQEHVDLVASMSGSTYLNEGRRVAESTLTAIMGRMSAYTGKEITWEQALNSKEDLSPDAYAFGDMPMPPVPMPGKTPLI